MQIVPFFAQLFRGERGGTSVLIPSFPLFYPAALSYTLLFPFLRGNVVVHIWAGKEGKVEQWVGEGGWPQKTRSDLTTQPSNPTLLFPLFQAVSFPFPFFSFRLRCIADVFLPGRGGGKRKRNSGENRQTIEVQLNIFP